MDIKSELRNGWGYLIPILFGLIMFLHYDWNVNDTIKNYPRLYEIKKQRINGVVVSRKKNSLSGAKSYNIILDNGTKFRDDWENIHMGDSIVKDINSHYLYVYRYNQKPIVIDFNTASVLVE